MIFLLLNVCNQYWQIVNYREISHNIGCIFMNNQITYSILDKALQVTKAKNCTSWYIFYHFFTIFIKNRVKYFSFVQNSFKFFYLFFNTFMSIIRNKFFIFNIEKLIKVLFLFPIKKSAFYMISSHILSNIKGYKFIPCLLINQLNRLLKDRIQLINITKTNILIFPY